MKITIKIKGMSCGGCRMSVEKALGRVPGVASAEVSLPKGEAVVDYDEKKAAPEDLRAAVKGAGFEAE